MPRDWRQWDPAIRGAQRLAAVLFERWQDAMLYRTLATLQPRPFTVGVGYGHGFIPWLKAEPHDVPLDAILTEDGVAWHGSD